MEPESILKDLVKFKTINNPKENIYPDLRIIDYIEVLLQNWNPNFQSVTFDQDKYLSSFYALDPKKRCDVIFMGHLDVVPIAEGWNSDPFTLKVDLGLAYGRGTKDCKGSVLSALLMVKDLSEENNPIIENIGLYFSSDEESGGRFGSRIFFKYLNKNNLLPKYVINVDGGTRVVNKRRGGFGVNITVPPNLKKINGNKKKESFEVRIIGGDSRHTAYFVKGCDTHPVISLSKMLHINRNLKLGDIQGSWIKGNVIPDSVKATLIFPEEGSEIPITYDENLTQLIRQVRSLILIDLPLDDSSEFGISVNPNIITYSPLEGTEMIFDVRAFLSPDNVEELIQAFNRRLGDFKDVATVTASGSTGYFCTPRENILVTSASRVLKNHNKPSKPCEQEGASDARYVSNYGVPVIDLGPKGGGIHGNNEYIILDSLIEFSKIYKEIIMLLIDS